jgi:hypothetical protein
VNFDKVWKEQIQVPKSKVGFWKPKEDIRSMQDKDDNECCADAFEKYYFLQLAEEMHYIRIILNDREIDKDEMESPTYEELIYYENTGHSAAELRGAKSFRRLGKEPSNCKKLKNLLDWKQHHTSSRGSLKPEEWQKVINEWEECKKNV